MLSTNISSQNLLEQARANCLYQRSLASHNKSGLPILEQGCRYGFAYIRVSTMKQVIDGFSLSHQEKQLADYCKSNKIQLLNTYSDDGISGGTMNRPGLNKMLSDLRPGMVVVCSSVSRLSRNTDQLSTIYNTINERKCSLIVLDVGVDTNSPIGQAIMKILGVFAEFERNQMGERISNVMNDMSKNGTLKTKPPYGWKRVNGILEEIQEEQATIQYIKALRQANPRITAGAIVKDLTMNDIYNRKGKPFHVTTVKSIIEHNNL